MIAIRVYQTGEPEVMVWEDVTAGQPGTGSLLIKNKATSVDYTDVYSRSGQFPPKLLPFTPGKDAAGEVVEAGEGVSNF